MSKWDKLDENLDRVLESLSKDDWEKWDSKKEANKSYRQLQLILQSTFLQTLRQVQTPIISTEIWRYGSSTFQKDDEETRKYKQKNSTPNNSGSFFLRKIALWMK